MPLSSFYHQRVQRFAREEQICTRQNNRYTWFRLLIVILAVIAGIYFYSVSSALSIGTVIVFIIIFAVCLKRHLQNIERQHHLERLKNINIQEINSSKGDYSAYAPGDQYINPKHDYTSDLDIFGSHSLFRYLNRTVSPSGSDTLAAWLSAPANTPEIKKRQAAVEELAGMVDWRQEVQAVGLKYKDTGREQPGFIKWLQSGIALSGNRKFLLAVKILPWVTVAAIMAASVGWTPSFCAWLLVAIHFVISGSVIKKVNLLHQQVSRKVDYISTYKELIGLFVDANFTSHYLTGFRNHFVETKALQQIKSLQNRIRKLDYRLNMLYIPVNILFFFDYKHLVWLEQWRLTSGLHLIKWFEIIAKVEALSSFANARHNNPSWAMPEIRDEYFTLETRNIGHPLITEKERVCNDFTLAGENQATVITGSNMSGKSTFLRSLGVNMALALSGAPVCAAFLAVTNCRLYTYMRIADNLEEHTSSFYAELKRLKHLIDITKNRQHVFFLLDEVLRGTNSRDRQTGSVALVKQLVGQQVSGIIATHDLALGNLQQELPGHVNNAHFDVQISGEDMLFDYKLYQGICTSLNASILMRKIGIEID
jgi:predicted ATPase/membrane protein implicated in regulation of membrane protease activity